MHIIYKEGKESEKKLRIFLHEFCQSIYLSRQIFFQPLYPDLVNSLSLLPFQCILTFTLCSILSNLLTFKVEFD